MCERQADIPRSGPAAPGPHRQCPRPDRTAGRREDDDQATSLRATVTTDGQVAPALEQVIARLSLEPGVRDLHWHLEDEEAEHDRPRVLASSPTAGGRVRIP
ncbi:hypothetical protein ACIRU5_36175 [Streptomyces misionensis]|uniref:hypothetical protein n=1 Tax=Streptomyces misionensis TaxID=67331 RepID=UPI00380869E6